MNFLMFGIILVLSILLVSVLAAGQYGGWNRWETRCASLNAVPVVGLRGTELCIEKGALR